MLDMNRVWLRGGVILGAGALTAVMLAPATGQAAPGAGDDVPVDQWPATDLFYDEHGRPTIWPAPPRTAAAHIPPAPDAGCRAG